eukprot:1943471-Prymnesium_polylepis.1
MDAKMESAMCNLHGLVLSALGCNNDPDEPLPARPITEVSADVAPEEEKEMLVNVVCAVPSASKRLPHAGSAALLVLMGIAAGVSYLPMTSFLFLERMG